MSNLGEADLHIFSALALALGLLVATADAAGAADREAGGQLASGGNAQGAAACVACHAPRPGPQQGGAPLLAGQAAEYIYKQLNDFASDKRQNPIMSPIAKALGDADRQNVAAYYGALNFSAPGTSANSVTSDQPQDTQKLLTIGNQAKGVQACGNCHGPNTAGEPPLNPQLAGQFASYTQAQLQAFRNGERRNDVAAVMREIASRLSDEDIASLSGYLASLPPTPATPPDRS
jgi:cytochrome c553